MLTLLLMRHAKSSWDDPQVADHDRPLNARGKRAAPLMGGVLRDNRLIPDLVLTSTARRAVDTAHAVALATGYDGRIEVTRRLYLAEPDTYLDVLAEVDAKCRRVLVIGHNPGLAELVAVLSGADEAMPTAAIAHLEIPAERFSEVRPGSATLRAVFRPKELA